MSIASMLESTGELRRPGISKDPVTGTTIQTPQVIATAIPCSIQTDKGHLTELSRQRTMIGDTLIFMAQNIGARVNDNFVALTGPQAGLAYNVEYYDDTASRGRLYFLDCKKVQQRFS